ncbi:cytochrome P450-like protein 20 [Dinothrombium tinctorium]|uniref:Cytochrome P450-like protein 20 n=1 Tax=Dinothrombium tinctorium TaxID=1965070 RepID=A0A3S3QYW7_9ACAR|nr:cytochrome P450-like protein 20 [Dinothrombium tinctorium]RWS16065.1 cytochrome P450-like protein 20 [Dinothrombium tinctorium]RWS16091.1 cytochrome P450-like protein 20 [Dinothrombium tinctorium]
MDSLVLTLVLPSIRLLLLFFIVFLIARLWFKVETQLPLPPGPFSIPFLGFLPFVGQDFHITLAHLSKRYGSVYQLFLGRNRIVVISDSNIIREAFRQPIFSGRPDTELTKILQGLGIVFSDGDLWKEQRSFLHGVLRQFGTNKLMNGRNGFESKIKEQVTEFLNNLQSFEEKPCRIRPLLASAVSNVVGSVLISSTLKNEEKKSFERLLSLMEEGFKLVTIAMPANFLPLFRYMPCVNRAYQKIKANRAETCGYFKKIVTDHRKTLDPFNIRDICDAYIVQQEKVQKDGKKSYFSDEQLIQIMNDVFSAGMETVTSTLDWAILFLMLYPKVQRNIQEEIDMVIGEQREPSLSDLPKMPYTEATIYEVLRRSTVIALGNAHLTLNDTILAGYRIPKNSQILPNLYAIHMDPKLWKDPELFDPNRFLRDGKIFKPNYFIPFSVGRRMCLGDTLTRMEVFLFLTGLLKKYNLQVPPNEEMPSTKGTTAVSTVPKPYNVYITLRRV